MKSTVYIIHHASCFDGVTGAWVVDRWVRPKFPDSEVIIHPAHYGDLAPNVTGAFVYIVDFSYPRDTLLRMHGEAEMLTVIDHHHTAKEALENLPFCTFDMERSGAGLAWDLLFPQENRPWLVMHVEDRDLWRFRIPGTKEVIAYLASRPLTVENIEETTKFSQETIIQKGEGILSYIDTFGEKVCEQWTLREILGHFVPVINTPYMNCSDHIDKLSEKLPGHPFYASFFMLAGGRWQFSLRSKGIFDVSAIAKQFGGGGHKQAAGFTVEKLPWLTS